MIGDIVSLQPHHIPPAEKIVDLAIDDIRQADGIYTFTVGGESGSGKSTLSLAVKQVLQEQDFTSFIFHIDDYFKLPPQDNHRQRKEDITHVGPEEVNLDLLQEHIEKVKAGAQQLKKPLVHYRENRIREVIVEFEGVDVIIAEGTYSTLLEEIDCKIFMLRNFFDTYADRMSRGREPMIPFNEKVLEIEHKILQDHIDLADIFVSKEYEILTDLSEKWDSH